MQEQILILLVLVFSIIIHELAHGYSAEFLGDATPRLQGRLTLNPIPHIDPIGSIFLPMMLFFLHSPILFGWAKPIEYNPRNISPRKLGGMLVAFAGPLSNLVLVFACVSVLSFYPVLASHEIFSVILHAGIFINLILAIFNLIPIPPLDGHHILFGLLPDSLFGLKIFLRRYGFLILLVFIFFMWKNIIPFIEFIYTKLITF